MISKNKSITIDRPISENKQRKQAWRTGLRYLLVLIAIALVFLLIRRLLRTRLDNNDFQIATVEIGNVENAISAYGSLVPALEEQINAPIATEINEALALAIKRHNSLNQFMKNFAEVVRLPAPKFEWMNVAALLQKVVSFMRPNLEAVGIQIHFDESGASGVRKQIDVPQFEQALLNILKNAREAIGQNGQVKVCLYNNPLRMVIADNGKGINPEKEKQLFTPLF